METRNAQLTGKLPSQRVLTGEQIKEVHDSSLVILERVGILVEHKRVLAMLADAGATVDFKTQLVKIPGWLVEESLEKAPTEFVVTGQHPSKDLVLSYDSEPRARPVLSLDWIVDPGQKRRRQVTLKDLENWVRVVDALPNMSMVSGIYPWDVPIATRDIRAAEVMLEFSDKPILIAAYSGETVRWMAGLLSVIPGQRPSRIVAFSSCNSPLIYSESQMDVLLVATEYDFPVMVNSSAVTGTTAPITLAGSLVIMNAEILTGIVVSQIAKPGAMVLYAGHPVFLDMRTATASCGHTEAGLLAAALVDLGENYRLPTGSNGLTTDSHTCDEQAAVEKLITGYQAVLSGASLNGGAGSLAAVGTASLEQLVIDDDIYDRIFRIREGITFDKDTLALDVIAEVGPMHHFLDNPHTIKYMRQEYRFSKIACRLNPEVWAERGGQDSLDVAAARVKTILEKLPEPRLEPEVVNELRTMAREAEQSTVSPELRK